MMKIKYCVANLYVDLQSANVTYYAYQKGQYGLHLTNNWKDENVIWYDSEEQAKKHILNTNECIISILEEYIPKFNTNNTK